jgi:hypothetical protein
MLLLNPFRPVPGAIRYTLQPLEYARAAVSGISVASVILLLQFLAAHVDLLPINHETGVSLAAVIAGVVALLQLCLQFFQPAPQPPAPAPAPNNHPSI